MNITKIAPVLLLFSAFATAGTTDQEKADAFQKFVAQASEVKIWAVVVKHPKEEAWTKYFHTLGTVRYDLKRTDSLITPILGKVSFAISIATGGPFPTEGEALAALEPTRAIDMRYEILATYDFPSSGISLVEINKERDVSNSRIKTSVTGTEARAGKIPPVPSLERWIK